MAETSLNTTLDTAKLGTVRVSRRRLCIGGVAVLAAPDVFAQDRNHTVSLIVPFAPGGIADLTARPFAIPLAKELDQSVVVENRAGAGGAVGMAYASRQKADGNTLLMALSSIVTIPEADKVMGRPVSYTLDQFTPIALVSADPTVLIVRADSRWKTVNDLIAEAKAKPRTLTFSSSGIYGTTHVAQAMLWQSAGVELTHIPYSGGGPSMTALLGGQVDITTQAPGTVASYVKSGAVRLLGTWGAHRLPNFPDVPTFKELGYDVEFYIWSALFAPAGLPTSKLDQLRVAARKSTQDQGFVAAMTTMETPIRYLQGAELQTFLMDDQRRLAKVVQAMGRLE
jgi:tripartite-type tricarboxylate transporter receptor subunit TctC